MQSYYTDRIDNSNQTVDNKYLFVNCTGVCVFDTDFPGRSDLGRNDYYILYLNKGRMHLDANGCSGTMNGGQLIVLPPKTPYRYQNEKGSSIEYLWLHFSGFEAEQMLQKAAVPCNQILTVGFDERIIETFTSLFHEYLLRDEGFEFSCISKLIALCVLFGRCSQKENNKSLQTNLSSSLTYIHKNFCTDINIDFLAQMEHVSTGYYRHIFKHHTGLSPIDYITSVRLRHGCELIRGTNLSVKEIASLVGYEDQMYFSRIFKKKLGVSPKHYRK